MKRRLVTIAALFACSFAWADNPVALAIHGGAGTIRPADLTASQEEAIHAALAQSLHAGHARLKAGDSAEEAVIAAIVVLEDSPHFNAGHGAVFNAQGVHELDASIMRGVDRNAGAATGVRHVRNPILLAARVMTESPHVLLAGQGAEEFALQQQLELVPNDYYSTPRRRAQLDRAQASLQGTDSELPVALRMGTVGAVALDQHGNIAAGTSTGGMTNKQFGRIGDSPVIGAGTYADNATCAVSATGHGEYFMRAVVAHDIAAQMAYANKPLRQAAETVVMDKLAEFGGSGGVIAIDAKGNIALVHNTPGMYRGSIDTGGQLQTAIYAAEK